MKPLFALGLVLLQAVISVHTELVAVPVTVTDAIGHHVGGLSRENFRIFEDGRQQPIAVFHRGDVPVAVGLVVDRSRTMRSKQGALTFAVSALIRTSRPDDELFAVSFNDRVSLVLPASRPFTSDAKELEAAVAAVHADGRTALYDGVFAGLEHLQLAHAGKRALIVVSDGGDNASRQTYARVRDLARRSDTVIYAVGLMGTFPANDEEDAGLLERICKDTGGLAFFPETDGEIAAMSAQIARDIREQYLLGFVPGGRTHARAFRKIRVTVSVAGQKRLHVRTRSGYLTGGEHPEDDRKDRR